MNKPQDVESVQSEDMHPEADSYRYIEVLLESLGTMGRLGSALDVVSQRVAGEIHALVEATLDEVEERSVALVILPLTPDLIKKNPSLYFNPKRRRSRALML